MLHFDTEVILQKISHRELFTIAIGLEASESRVVKLINCYVRVTKHQSEVVLSITS